MSNNAAVDVEIRLRLKDESAAKAKAVEKTVEQIADKTATATERAAKRSAEATEKGNAQQRSSYERTALAREQLGVRSEKAIQREIDNTRRAYATLAAAGFSSAREQERSYAAVQARVTSLTNEMGKLTVAQRKAADEAKRLAQVEADAARGQRVVRGVVAGVAGVAAAGYTLKNPALESMSFDRKLAGMANTAYAERDAGGRIIGMKTLERGITSARRFGGGTRDQAADALDSMIASGTVSEADAIKMLPGIMKASTASGAGATELATIAIRAKQSFKIAPEDLPGILSAAMAAGQAGGFELKDMAKWLPQQMAMGGNLGLSGKSGFAKLAAWNQASVITAGTKDEGGNNLRDLLMELNTPHFKKFLGDVYLGDGEKGKKGVREKRAKSIDQLFLDYQDRGVDKVSATLDIMEKVFAKDKGYQALQTKLKATGADDKDGRRGIIEAMAAQIQGSATGKVFHNQQSLMAFLGLMNNQDYVKDVFGKTFSEYSAPSDKSAIGTSFEVMSGTPSYKLEQAGEEKTAAQKSAMDNLTPAIGKVADAFGSLAAQYPELTGSTTLATTALTALAGAAGLATLAMGGKIPGESAIGRTAKMMATGGRWGGGIGLAAAGGYAIGTGLNWLIDKGVQWGTGDNSASLGTWIYDKTHPEGSAASSKQVDVNGRFQIALAPGLVLQSQSVQSSGGKVYVDTGNVNTGAPK